MEHLIRMILVDDDEDDRQLFEKAVIDLNLNIDLILIEDGISLMNCMNTLKDDIPTVIFLDLNMPLKSGIECLKIIRADEAYKDISIAIYSTSSSEKDIEETFVNGANIFIKKPNSFKDLKKVIEKVLKINWQYSNSSLNRETFLMRL